MDNTNQNPSGAPAKNMTPVIVAAVALLGLAALVYAMNSNSEDSPADMQSSSMELVEDESVVLNEDDLMMLDEEMDSERNFEVTASDFAYSMNEIRVSVGDTVNIMFRNLEGNHDLVIDELNVRTPILSAGQDAEVSFVASEPGTYEYYCSVGEHRAMGMVGKLIIE